MRVVFDACVLVPEVLRTILVGLVDNGVFVPVWSTKIFDEWQFASQKYGEAFSRQVDIEILLLKSKWKSMIVRPDSELENKLYLPDANDRHVLATAIIGKAELLITNNLKDFPGQALAKHKISVRSPDNILVELHDSDPQMLIEVIDDAYYGVHKKMSYFNFKDKRSMIKRSHLPKLAKVI